MRIFFLTIMMLAGTLSAQSNIVECHRWKIKLTVSSGRMSFVPSFENCSIYINKTDDEEGKEIPLKLSYREKGGNWGNAIEPVYFPDENAWRGSILLLKENTEYEIKAEIGDKTETGFFKTRDSNFPIAKTIELNNPTVITESGVADGYIRYIAKEPLVGKKNDIAVIRAIGAKYLIFDGIAIRGNGARHGISLEKTSDVVVRNCDISGFGRMGERRTDKDGKFYIDEKFIDRDAGINIDRSASTLVERCFIHNPANRSNSWFFSHPTGPQAIVAHFTKGRNVIRYNDFVGNDLHRWNDVIEAGGNGHMDGGLFRDSDVYGNLLAFGNDDAVELEGGGMNMRCYFNRLEGTYCGTSSGRCSLGPVYIFRNLIHRLGDENGAMGAAFKNGMGIEGKGPVFFFNNTVTENFGKAFHPFSFKKPALILPEYKGISFNNLVASLLGDLTA